MSDPAAAILDFASSAPPVSPSSPDPEPSAAPSSADGSAPPPETPAAEPEAPSTETALPSGEPSTPTPAGEMSLKQLRDAVKSLSEASPEHAPALKRMLDDAARYRAMTETFPDVDTARSTKAALDAVGGVEGISALQELASAVEETDGQLEAGDPAVLDSIFEDAPEGAVKLAPAYLNKLEKVNPEAFMSAMLPHFVRYMSNNNFDNVLAGLAESTKDNAGATPFVRSMQSWWDEQKRSGQKFNEDALAPERSKLKEGWTKLEQQQLETFRSEVGRDVESHSFRELGTRLRPYLANANIPDRMKRDIAQSAIDELGRALETDSKTVEAMMRTKSRDRGKIVGYVNSRVSAVADAVVRQVVKDYGLSPGKATPVKPPATKPSGPPPVPKSAAEFIKVAQRPSDDEIDWEAPGARNAVITGKAKLRNGKYVRWR
jgi:hypothetical protein